MKRYRILYKRPEITIDDAGNIADFNRLMQAHKARAANNRIVKRIAVATGLFVALVGLIFYGNSIDFFELENSAPIIPDKEINVTNKTQTKDQSLNLKGIQDHPEESTVEKEELIPVEAPPKVKGTPNTFSENSASIVSSGFVEAKPINGYPALYQYFDKNLVYPTDILDKGIEGSVIVKFVIDINGFPEKIAIEKSLQNKLDSTAFALIQRMPIWSPASLNGKAIPSTHRIPIYFQINQTTN